MPRALDYAAGDAVAEWTLGALLGSGGNAEVWRATGSGGEVVALKILRRRSTDSEPFRRFRDEVEAMNRIGTHLGVLPLLGHSLPERPTRANPAWIATPVAIPIRSALGMDSELRDAVAAIADVADTLHFLAEHHHIYHRDIKPENLYRWDEVWCVGDFGLVTYPGKDEITVAGRHIGPLYYLAPELLMGDAVDPGPADVFALAKTVWVLATGQTYPLPGHLAADVEQFRLSTFTSVEGTRPLDLLIARATLPNPAARPTMSEMSVELRAWLKLATIELAGYLPLSALDRVAPLVNARVRAIEEVGRRKAYVLKRLEEITASLRPLGDAVSVATDLQPEYGAWSMFTDASKIRALLPLEGVSYQRHAAFHITVPALPNASSVSLVSGIIMTVTADGNTHVLGAHVVYRGASVEFTDLTKPIAAPMESALEHIAIDDALAMLSRSLGQAVEAFADAISKAEIGS